MGSHGVRYDAVIVGAGPNGLTAAVTLAAAGLAVLVLEARDTIGGGARTRELTLPGFSSDVCSAIHPLARMSPAFRDLALEREELEWIEPPLALVHPFDDGSAAWIEPSLDATAASLGADGRAWRRLMEPLLRDPQALFAELLRPLRVPRDPLRLLRFAWPALQSCDRLVRSRFAGPRARALFAGCAAHSLLPLDAPASASFGLVLALAAHAVNWPVARGGSQRIAAALAARLRAHGGEIRTDCEVRAMDDLPAARAVLFDLAPGQVARIAAKELPAGYRHALERYRHGPGVFKIDWALDGPIPWTAPECGRAATVHLGPTHEAIAAAERDTTRGGIARTPFVIVAQQSLFDASRAPAGHHVGWAYCHVPHGSTVDMTEAIERQVERMAPGFRDRILARHAMHARDLERHNPSMIGGDVAGGANDLAQIVFRPTLRWNPYTTPNPRLFLCSSATPPGGGVHGMCGYGAARAALKRAGLNPAARARSPATSVARG